MSALNAAVQTYLLSAVQTEILPVRNVATKIRLQILISSKNAKPDAENMQKENNTNSATTVGGIKTLEILKTEEPWT